MIRDARIPMPLQLVLDDVGWWRGADDSTRHGPYRTGIARDHVVADYTALAELGRRLNMRPQAVFIAAEWDRHNRLRELPNSTWMGGQWDNSRWVGPWLDEAAQIIRDHPQHIEIALHSLAHEHWENGKFTRAALYDAQGHLRPRDYVERHLDLFARILDDNRLPGFPQSYAPCAGHHRFGAADGGLSAMLARRGVRFMCTPFFIMSHDRPTQLPTVGLEAGVLVIDRMHDFISPWYAIDCHPSSDIPGPICGLHWPNILHPDPARNLEVVERWVAFLKPLNHRLDRVLSPDTASCWSQAAYQAGTRMQVNNGAVQLDFADLASLEDAPISDTMLLKVAATADAKFTARNFVAVESRFDARGGNHVLKLRRERSCRSGEVLTK